MSQPGADEVIITLDAPIEAHGETLREIRLRRPLVGDIVKSGSGALFAVNVTDGTLVPNTAGMMKMVCHLAAIPPSSLQKLTLADWSQLEAALLGFSAPVGTSTPTSK